MDSYDQSTRSRYWRDSTQSLFGSVFRREHGPHSGLMLTVIFVVTVFAIVIMRDSDSVFLVFLLGVVFASLFLGFYKAPHANHSSAPVPPFASPTAADRSISPEAGRLLAALEQLEKRLVNLETIITQKEFDWERRLNQDPPPSTQPHPAPAAPGGASPVA